MDIFRKEKRLNPIILFFRNIIIRLMILESMVFLSCLNNIYQERPFRYDGVIVYKEDRGR